MAIASSLSVTVVMQKLTFCNTSHITEGIYLPLRICVLYTKSNPYYQGKQFKIQFFSVLGPFFDLDFLTCIKHPIAEHFYCIFFFIMIL